MTITSSLRLDTLVMVDEDGRLAAFTLHSQKSEIIEFLKNNQNHSERIKDPEILESLHYMKYKDFEKFIKDNVIQRGMAEITAIKYKPHEDEPF